MASNNIARLGVILGLDSAEFVRGLDKANKQLYDFAARGAGVTKDVLLAVGVAFAAATYKAMEFADAIADVAKANDVSIASVIKLNDALANNGGEAENAGKLLSGFTKFMDNAATGSFEAQKALKQAGISLKDLANLDTEDLFNKTVQGIAAIEDPLTRNAKAMEVFGKAAKGVDFVGLAEDMRKSGGASDEQAKAIQAAADSYDLIKQRSRDFQLSFVTEIGPSLLVAIQYFDDLGKEINKTGGLWREMFNTVAYQTASLVHEIQDLIQVFVAWDAVLNAFFELRWTSIGGIVDSRNADRASEEAKLEAFRKRLEGIRDVVNDINKGIDNGFGKFDPGKGEGWDSGKPDAPKRIVKPGIDAEAEAARKKQLALELKGLQVKLEMQEEVRKEQAQASDADMKAELKRWTMRQAAIDQGRQTAEDQRAEALAAIDAQKDMYTRGEAAQRQMQALQNQNLDRAHELFLLETSTVSLAPERLKFEKESLDIRNQYLDNVKAIAENQALDSDARVKALSAEEASMKRQTDSVAERYRVLSLLEVNTTSLAAERLQFEKEFLSIRNQYLDNVKAINENQSLGDDARAEALKTEEGLMRQQINLANERYRLLSISKPATINLAPERLKLEKEFLSIRNQYIDNVKAINENQALDSNARAEALKTEEGLMRRQIDLATERYRINKEITDQQKTFSGGWKKAFDEYEKAADAAGEHGGDAFRIVTGNMSSAIDELVDKGITSFDKLIVAIINDMTKIYLKQLMMKAIGGITDIASAAFSPSVSLASAAPLMSGGFGFGMHATGGNLGANSPSWVGERGPELFIPQQSGMIVPNNALGDNMSSQPANVYNGPYIAQLSAIDTQSGLQFLAKNKQGVWAANQSANRSIPMSR